ncbi:DUF1737 domain-containing protein [uncultured Cohaesibacter sp.]|uniref:DUF1737 domain-containing protein n=1 Tax=uncultured Cohaesibacter sp. TaxID=1002546 RepID=UPI0029302C31|nr:DUF1737 domain-containing protein [uncultured Cohaesibacter sp.]
MNEKQRVYRFLTGVDNADFCHKVTEALSKGWVLHGSPSYAFDAEAKVMKCGQAVVKDVEPFAYSREVVLGSI